MLIESLEGQFLKEMETTDGIIAGKEMKVLNIIQ